MSDVLLSAVLAAQAITLAYFVWSLRQLRSQLYEVAEIIAMGVVLTWPEDKSVDAATDRRARLKYLLGEVAEIIAVEINASGPAPADGVVR